jgi:hypothetical protein
VVVDLSRSHSVRQTLFIQAFHPGAGLTLIFPNAPL